MRILLVEDDPDLSRQLKLALGDAGYAVDHAADGEEAHYLGEAEPYDAVILDLGLPKIDGVSVLERWRRDGKTTPVLILTARGAWSDKVSGFDAGADDYLTKPFHTEELLARLRALLRRSAGVARGRRRMPKVPAWSRGPATRRTRERVHCEDLLEEGRPKGFAHRRLASVGASRGAGTRAGGPGPSAAAGNSCRRMPRGRLAYQP
jgi:DNA-binding response OmpR family regulator